MVDQAVWVTGASGFVGQWLLRALNERGLPALALAPLEEQARLPDTPCVTLDLATAAFVPPGGEVLDVESLPKPLGFLHLAALSFPPACEADPDLARAVNVVGPARLYEQLLDRWPECPVLHVSSGHVYQPGPEPLAEDLELEPVNVYGATKLEGEAVALGMRDRGYKLTVVRPFNHTGAGQAANFALPSFALRIADLEQRGGGTLTVGNLDGVRDFLHVRQVVDAYLELMLKHAERATLVNVCSGTGRSIGEYLDGLLERAKVSVEVEIEGGRLRGTGDPSHLVGDPSRLQEILGTTPKLDFAGLLDELLDDARARVASGEDLARA